MNMGSIHYLKIQVFLIIKNIKESKYSTEVQYKILLGYKLNIIKGKYYLKVNKKIIFSFYFLTQPK